jgi:uncharacterized membrane protein YqaE (UPF0057 family)
MKNKRPFLWLAGFAAATFLLSSCSSLLNQEFSSRKYTHFRQGHGEVTVHQDNTAPEKTMALEPVNLTVPDVIANDQVSTHTSLVSEVSPVTLAPQTITTSQHVITENGQHVSTIKMLKELRRQQVTMKKQGATRQHDDANTILVILLCIFLPPVAVLIVKGVSTEFWLDLLLTLLFWLPGMIYAFIVCL